VAFRTRRPNCLLKARLRTCSFAPQAPKMSLFGRSRSHALSPRCQPKAKCRTTPPLHLSNRADCARHRMRCHFVNPCGLHAGPLPNHCFRDIRFLSAGSRPVPHSLATPRRMCHPIRLCAKCAPSPHRCWPVPAFSSIPSASHRRSHVCLPFTYRRLFSFASFLLIIFSLATIPPSIPPSSSLLPVGAKSACPLSPFTPCLLSKSSVSHPDVLPAPGNVR